MMGFWDVVGLVLVVGIITEFVVRIVKMGTRYYENIERIKRGYPTTDGKLPFAHSHHHAPEAHEEFVSVGDRLQ